MAAATIYLIFEIKSRPAAADCIRKDVRTLSLFRNEFGQRVIYLMYGAVLDGILDRAQELALNVSAPCSGRVMDACGRSRAGDTDRKYWLVGDAACLALESGHFATAPPAASNVVAHQL